MGELIHTTISNPAVCLLLFFTRRGRHLNFHQDFGRRHGCLRRGTDRFVGRVEPGRPNIIHGPKVTFNVL